MAALKLEMVIGDCSAVRSLSASVRWLCPTQKTQHVWL